MGGTVEDTPTTFRMLGVQLCHDDGLTLADIELRRETPDAPFLIKSIDLRDTS